LSVPTTVASAASKTWLANVRMSPTVSPVAPVSVVLSVVACSMTVIVLP